MLLRRVLLERSFSYLGATISIFRVRMPRTFALRSEIQSFIFQRFQRLGRVRNFFGRGFTTMPCTQEHLEGS